MAWRFLRPQPAEKWRSGYTLQSDAGVSSCSCFSRNGLRGVPRDGIARHRDQGHDDGQVHDQWQVAIECRSPRQLTDSCGVAQRFYRDSGTERYADRNSHKGHKRGRGEGDNVAQKNANRPDSARASSEDMRLIIGVGQEVADESEQLWKSYHGDGEKDWGAKMYK